MKEFKFLVMATIMGLILTSLRKIMMHRRLAFLIFQIVALLALSRSAQSVPIHAEAQTAAFYHFSFSGFGALQSIQDDGWVWQSGILTQEGNIEINMPFHADIINDLPVFEQFGPNPDPLRPDGAYKLGIANFFTKVTAEEPWGHVDYTDTFIYFLILRNYDLFNTAQINVSYRFDYILNVFCNAANPPASGNATLSLDVYNALGGNFDPILIFDNQAHLFKSLVNERLIDVDLIDHMGDDKAIIGNFRVHLLPGQLIWNPIAEVFETDPYVAVLGIDSDTFVHAQVIIPEPSTLFLLGSGLAGLVVFGRKRLFKKTRETL